MTMSKCEPIILDEDCASRRVLELFSVKWTTMVLHSLHFNGGTCRTGALARSLPGCSKKMLTQTLREMERDRLIDRKVYPVVPTIRQRTEGSIKSPGQSAPYAASNNDSAVGKSHALLHSYDSAS